MLRAPNDGRGKPALDSETTDPRASYSHTACDEVRAGSEACHAAPHAYVISQLDKKQPTVGTVSLLPLTALPGTTE